MREPVRLTMPAPARRCMTTRGTLRSSSRRMSRFSNRVVASALLTFTFPLIAFVALAIKCESRGPIFVRHERIGPDARRFRLLTFRVTVHDPINTLPPWARRPTRLGWFLRYTRIVNLPQLVNAVRGEIELLEGDGWPGSIGENFRRTRSDLNVREPNLCSAYCGLN